RQREPQDGKQRQPATFSVAARRRSRHAVVPEAVGPQVVAYLCRRRRRGSGAAHPGGAAKTARLADGFPREKPSKWRTAIYHLYPATATARRAARPAGARTDRRPR